MQNELIASIDMISMGTDAINLMPLVQQASEIVWTLRYVESKVFAISNCFDIHNCQHYAPILIESYLY